MRNVTLQANLPMCVRGSRFKQAQLSRCLPHHEMMCGSSAGIVSENFELARPASSITDGLRQRSCSEIHDDDDDGGRTTVVVAVTAATEGISSAGPATTSELPNFFAYQLKLLRPLLHT